MNSICRDIFAAFLEKALSAPNNTLSPDRMSDVLNLAKEAYQDMINGNILDNDSILVWYMHKIDTDISDFLKEAQEIADHEKIKSELDTCTSTIHTPEAREALTYRYKLPVKLMLVFENGDTYPICPRCNVSFETEYTEYCTNCGQHLWWKAYKHAQKVFPGK